MSTHSRIGISISATKVTSIYCHWNGYPEFNGAILLKHYTNREDVEALMNLGNLSCLGRSPVAPDVSIIDLNGMSPPEHIRNQIIEDNKANNTMGYPFCIPHSLRDDFKDDCQAIEHGCNDWPNYDQEYEYRFTRKGTWSYRKVGNKKFMPLTLKSVTKK